MHLTVNQSLGLRGTVLSPSSKSQSIRSLLFALLAKGESTLLNVLDADDTQAARQVCAALGARIQVTQYGLIIRSCGVPLSRCASEINTGNSGITTHFVLPLLGLRKNYAMPVLLMCGEQMQGRPIKSLVNALRQLGMTLQYREQENRLPLLVRGRLMGGVTEVDGITSQYLSALLIALPCAEKESVITVRNLHERSYVTMTLAGLQRHGIAYTHHLIGDVDRFHIPGQQRYKPMPTTIAGDFSSISCLIAAAALLPGELELQRLDHTDAQGDKRLTTILRAMGADIVLEQETIRIRGGKTLTGIRIDANDVPDLVPALAVIATQAAGKTEIVNVKHARLKETDRIHSMTAGLRKMGARIEEHPDGMSVYTSRLHGAVVKGYGDHRTVMALTVAGLIAQGTTTITDGEAINKTYPRFVETMRAIGGNMTLHEAISRRHIILLGFKHVGKTYIGRRLAQRLNREFIDLDRAVERLYQQRHAVSFTCRRILHVQGAVRYRELESAALEHVLKLPACVIALGGGTALSQSNQALITPHRLIHVVAPRGIVFERIMVEGRSALFDPSEDPYESFTRLWNERDDVYRTLTPYTVDNSGTVESALHEALAHCRPHLEGSHPEGFHPEVRDYA